jgi:hypothetical protein
VVVSMALIAAVLADQSSWPRDLTGATPTFDPVLPASGKALVHQLPAGAVMAVPFDVSLGEGHLLEPGRPLLWALQHGRPVSATSEVVTDTNLRESTLARLLVNRQFAASLTGPQARVSRNLPGGLELTEQQVVCARVDAGRLSELGFAGVLLDRTNDLSAPIQQALEVVLGPPLGTTWSVAVWRLPTTAPAWDGPCKPVRVHPRVQSMVQSATGP